MKTIERRTRPVQILVVGGGYVGLQAARRLQQRLLRGEGVVTVVDPQPNSVYQPFLAEVAGGALDPRHVVVPLRKVLRRSRVLTGRVTGIDHDRKVATVTPADGPPFTLGYDVLVMAAGAVARTLPVPGAESGPGFRSVDDAVLLRDHVLSRLDLAASTDARARRRALTFVFVGGGFAGVEALAEVEDLAREALRLHPGPSGRELRWVLVEATDRILPEMRPEQSGYTLERLRRRGVDVRLGTTVRSARDGHVVLSDGTELDAGTVVWTAGIRPSPLATDSRLPVDDRGRLVCGADLRVRGVKDVWAAGDGAAVPDLSRPDDPDALCAATAQHAVRQARRLADNIIAELRGRTPRPYRHRDAGSLAGLGHHRGVAEVYGLRLRGLPAWLLHRVYHLMQVPTLSLRSRIAADWAVAAVLGREVVSLVPARRPDPGWEQVAA